MGKNKIKGLSRLIATASIFVLVLILAQGTKNVYINESTIIVQDNYANVDAMLQDIAVSSNGVHYSVQKTGVNTAKLIAPEELQGLDYSNFYVSWILTSENGDVSLRFMSNGIPLAQVDTNIEEFVMVGNKTTFAMPNSYDLPAFAREDRLFVQDHTGFATDDGTWITADNIVGTVAGDKKIEDCPYAEKWHDAGNNQTSVEVLPTYQPEVSVPVTTTETPLPTAPTGPVLTEGEF